MIITTDDLNQQDWSLFEYFDKLKEEFPKFKLLAFFTPFWKEENTIIKQSIINSPKAFNPKEYINIKFLDFLKERKDWLFLGAHGLFHCLPEFSLDLQFQTGMFHVSNFIRKYLKDEGIKYESICKPPFYKFNENAFELAKHYRWDLCIQSGLIDFEQNKYWTREELNIIDSHVSTGCPMPDRIDKFYNNLRLILKGELKDKREFHYG